ncbi:MAG: hypothetical protein Q4B22_10660 [Eubacteriales bacterium]|nr:hypothetical protein [Eubacteriales bacterium]
MDRMNLEKFRRMPFRNKIQWIFNYYGLKILAALVGIFVAVYFVKSVFFAPPAPDVTVIMLTDHVTEEAAVRYQQELSEKTGKSIEIVHYDARDSYGMQAFSVKVGTDLVDLVIAPEEESSMLAENGFFLSYAQIPGTDDYMGISRRAQAGEALQTVMEYLEVQLTNAENG